MSQKRTVVPAYIQNKIIHKQMLPQPVTPEQQQVYAQLRQVDLAKLRMSRGYCLGVEVDGKRVGFYFDAATKKFHAYEPPAALDLNNYQQHLFLGENLVITTGGINFNYTLISDKCTVWDLVSKKCVELPPMHEARFCHSSLYYNGRIYCLGGMTHPYDERSIVSRAEYFDLAQNRWIRMPPMRIPRCSFFTMLFLGNSPTAKSC